MRKKIIITLLFFVITAGILAGCEENRADSSNTKDTTEITTKESLADGSEEETIQSDADTDVETVDFSFLYGAPVKIQITGKQYDVNVSTFTDGTNELENRSVKIDVIDTGSSYRLNVASVEYDLKVLRTNFDTFIQQAIENDGTYETDMNGDNLCIHNIIEGKEKIVCMGETFQLTYCKDRSMGRGYECEFLGEDGQTYHLVTNLESETDDYTGEEVWTFAKDGEVARRKITYEKDAYIDIPYNMAENTNIGACANGERQNTSSPAGNYFIMYDANGEIVKLQDLSH